MLRFGRRLIFIDRDSLLKQSIIVVFELLQIFFGFGKNPQNVVEGDIAPLLRFFAQPIWRGMLVVQLVLVLFHLCGCYGLGSPKRRRMRL